MRNEYPYLYETHLHTNQGSACGRFSGAEMAAAAKAYGYTGIIVTEHNWGGNTSVPNDLPWKDWVEQFIEGYLDAKRYGDANDLDVFWGYESGYLGTDLQGTEFLIYGVDPQWLVDHPEIRDADPALQYDLIHRAGGMVIHAHPFREEPYITDIRLFPDLVDGVEGINAHHSSLLSTAHYNPDQDEKAVAYARKHSKPITAGSDIHRVTMLGGGVAFKRRLTSVQDYCRAILNGEDYVLTNGQEWFDKAGNPL